MAEFHQIDGATKLQFLSKLEMSFAKKVSVRRTLGLNKEDCFFSLEMNLFRIQEEPDLINSQIRNELMTMIKNLEQQRSGWNLKEVFSGTFFSVKLVPLPQQGSYVHLPNENETITNNKNFDVYCALRSVLTHLPPVQNNNYGTQICKAHFKELVFDGIVFIDLNLKMQRYPNLNEKII